jgi:amino acid transporter
MIPIAGSAYTYTYATMGELIAWIIGWDLILEYAVSNMAVSVGFSAHLVGMFDWFGFHPALRWISPAYLPGGLTDLRGNVLYTPGLHFGFNFPAFLVVMILTVILVRGIRESAEANNVMVILKIAAILAFVIVGSQYVHPTNWHPFAPMGWSGILTGGSIIFFTYIGFDSVSTAAEEARNPQRDLPIGIIATLVVCTVLYIGVAVVLTGIVPWQSVRDDAAPVVNAMKLLTVQTGSHTLNSSGSPLRRDDGHDFVATCVPAWTGASLVFHVARWTAASALRAGASAVPHASNGYVDRRFPGRRSGRLSGYWHTFRSFKHWDALRVRSGFDRRDHFALSRSRTASRVPCSWWHCSAGVERILLRSAYVRSAHSDLAAILCLASYRPEHLLSL